MVSPGFSKSRKRSFDYEGFRKIADYCEAEVLTDMAHFAGLVASGVHPSPMPMWSLRQSLKICADSVEGCSCPRKPIWKESPTMLFFMKSGVLILNAIVAKDIWVKFRNPISSYMYTKSGPMLGPWQKLFLKTGLTSLLQPQTPL